MQFARLPVGVPDDDTWRITHNVTRAHSLEDIECFPDAVKMIFAGQHHEKLLIKL